MKRQENLKEQVVNFIMKVCSREREIEVRRQILCDKNDFEPYVAFSRLTKNGSKLGISPISIHHFLRENHYHETLQNISSLIQHYDQDKSTELSYTEFLEIVLPREHPELRAFVTQREGFEIKKEDQLSSQTESALAELIEEEIALFSELSRYKKKMDVSSLNSKKIVEMVDTDQSQCINFNNLKAVIEEVGVVPFDYELIAFLKRVDRDDDGVLNVEEFQNFLDLFTPASAPELKHSQEYERSRKPSIELMPGNSKFHTMDSGVSYLNKNSIPKRRILSRDNLPVRSSLNSSSIDYRSSVRTSATSAHQNMKYPHSNHYPRPSDIPKQLPKSKPKANPNGAKIINDSRKSSTGYNSVARSSLDTHKIRRTFEDTPTIPNNSIHHDSNESQTHNFENTDFDNYSTKNLRKINLSKPAQSKKQENDYIMSSKDNIYTTFDLENPNTITNFIKREAEKQQPLEVSSQRININSIEKEAPIFSNHSQNDQPESKMISFAHITTLSTNLGANNVNVKPPVNRYLRKNKQSDSLKKKHELSELRHIQTKSPALSIYSKISNKENDRPNFNRTMGHRPNSGLNTTKPSILQKLGLPEKAKYGQRISHKRSYSSHYNRSSSNQYQKEYPRRSRNRGIYTQAREPSHTLNSSKTEIYKSPAPATVTFPKKEREIYRTPIIQRNQDNTQPICLLSRKKNPTEPPKMNIFEQKNCKTTVIYQRETASNKIQRHQFSTLKESKVVERIDTTKSILTPHKLTPTGVRFATPNQEVKLKSALKSTKLTAYHNTQEKILNVKWADDLKHNLEQYPTLKESFDIEAKTKDVQLEMLSSERHPQLNPETKGRESDLNHKISQKVDQIVKQSRGSLEKFKRDNTVRYGQQQRHNSSELNMLKQSIRASLDKIHIAPEKEKSATEFSDSNFNLSNKQFVNLKSIQSQFSGETSSKTTLGTNSLSKHEPTDIFKNSIRKILQLSRKLDQSKRDLFANPDFNMQKLFNMFDTKEEGFFNFDEFRAFFKKYKISFKSQDYLLDLFTSHDVARTYTLRLDDLKNMVYPLDRRIVREAPFNKRPFYRLTLNDVVEMFSNHIKLVEVIDEIKKDLAAQTINLEQVFKSLDFFKSGALSKEDFSQLLGMNHDSIHHYGKKDEELNLLIELMDSDKDGKISLQDFIVFFSV